MTLKSLKSIEMMLPKHEFMRVHRSYIIAINKIKVVSKNQITTIANQEIPISEGFRDEFNSLIYSNHI
jgi:two-component system, LytTR family, response regulator